MKMRRNGILVLILLFFLVQISFADEAPSTPYHLYNRCLFCKSYLHTVGYDAKHILFFPGYWNGKDWFEFGIISGGILALTKADIPLQRRLQPRRNDVIDAASTYFNPFGLWYAYGTMGIFYAGGKIFHSPKMQIVGMDAISASLITHGVVQLLKHSFGRARPFKHEGAYHFSPFSGDDSFPSGHATEAFTVATVISSYYHPFWARLTAYSVASLVGMARMDKDLHFVSDVTAGAILGTVVGLEVVHSNRKLRKQQFETEAASKKFHIYPVLLHHGISIQLVIS